jgi:hypothetical protein
VCASTLVHNERAVRERVVMPQRRMRRVCTGTPQHTEQAVWEGVGPAPPTPPAHPTAATPNTARYPTRGVQVDRGQHSWD